MSVPDPSTTPWVPLWDTNKTQGPGAGLITGDLVWSVLASRVGAIPCDGAIYDSVTDATFAALYTAIGITYGGTGPSNFAVPDVRGRLLVCRGQHTDVDQVGDSDGLGVASRSPVHNASFVGASTNTGGRSSDHSHYFSANSGYVSSDHSHAIGDPGHAHSVYDPGHSHGNPYDDGQDHNWQNVIKEEYHSASGGVRLIYGAGTGIGIYGAGTGIWTGGISANHYHGVSGQTGGESVDHVHGFTPSGSVGPGGSRPTNTPAYIVENCFIIK